MLTVQWFNWWEWEANDFEGSVDNTLQFSASVSVQIYVPSFYRCSEDTFGDSCIKTVGSQRSQQSL